MSVVPNFLADMTSNKWPKMQERATYLEDIYAVPLSPLPGRYTWNGFSPFRCFHCWPSLPKCSSSRRLLVLYFIQEVWCSSFFLLNMQTKIEILSAVVGGVFWWGKILDSARVLLTGFMLYLDRFIQIRIYNYKLHTRVSSLHPNCCSWIPQKNPRERGKANRARGVSICSLV